MSATPDHTARVQRNISKEAHNIPVTDPEQISFPVAWRIVGDVCAHAFAIPDKKPGNDIVNAYNELNHRLCQAHAIVYRLTAYRCLDCPSLVRGSSQTRVVGELPESTQVLVVYYLLREFLKKQLFQCKNFDTSSEKIIDNYLDVYEKTSAGVNMIKCIFTYIQWVWQKVGLPAEHIVLPTETVSMHLWSDIVLNEVKDKLATKVNEIVTAIRLGDNVDCHTVESVKRLSMNLSMLHNSHQTFFSIIIEGPYQANLATFYASKKTAFKRHGPERYIYYCLKAVAKEEFLARCLLTRQSLQKVRTQIITILVDTEEEYLRPAARDWVENDNVARMDVSRASLFGLYELMGGGTKATWMEKLITEYVAESATVNILSVLDLGDLDTTTPALFSIEVTYHKLLALIREVFGDKQPLFAAILAGFHEALNTLCADDKIPNFDTGRLSASLVKIASDKLSAGRPCGDGQDNWIAYIYRLLDNKDVFHAVYQRCLEIRLLNSTCFMLSKEQCRERYEREEGMLRNLFGQSRNTDFASACHRMMKDVYIISCECRGIVLRPVPLRPLVLRKFLWGNLAPPTRENLDQVPSNIAVAVNLFMYDYRNHPIGNGRHLTFLPQYSTATLRVKGNFGGSLVIQQIVVSCHQLSILLNFNSCTSWSSEQLAKRLTSTVGALEESLKPMVDSGLVTFNATKKTVTLSGSYRGSETGLSVLIPEFCHDAAAVAHTPVKSHVAASTGIEHALACESCIVKLLKQRRGLSLDELLAGAVEWLGRLEVSKQDIKKALDKLIERQFVERDEEPSTFSYLP